MEDIRIDLKKLKAESDNLQIITNNLQNKIVRLERIAASDALKKSGLSLTLNSLKREINKMKTEKSTMNVIRKSLLEIIRMYDNTEKTIAVEGKNQTIRSADPNDPNILPVDQLFFDKDKNEILYKGEKYPLYKPENTNNNEVTIGPQPKWKTIYKDSYTEKKFDWAVAIQGATVDGPDGKVYPGTQSNVNKIVAASAVELILSSVAAGASSTEITLELQKDKTTKKKRAIMGVSNSKATQGFRDYDYSSTYSMLSAAKAHGDGAGQRNVKGAGASLYEQYTGKKADTAKCTYDIQVNLDKRHKDSKYQSYISINDKGKFVQTIVQYPGDKRTVVVHNLVGKEADKTYDASIKDNTTKAVDSKVVEKIQKKFNIK